MSHRALPDARSPIPKVTPARALGLVHLPLSRADCQLKVALTAPTKTTPDTRRPVCVSVPQLAGKPAIFTISAAGEQALTAMDGRGRYAQVRFTVRAGEGAASNAGSH